jgi:putative DNA primase/helicase
MTITAGFHVLDFETEEMAPAFTDESLALSFAEQHANDLRYVASWARWMKFEGARWQFDETLHAFDLARHVCRDAASQCDKDSVASSLASAKTVAAVANLARSDRRLAATVDQWDADPWMLNTPKGLIDLHTGNMRPHTSDNYVTKITAVAPGGVCPMWHEFLKRITDGDSELQRFLQRVAGYSLTGSTREHALFFLYGVGANGKSVTINTVAKILGDYHRTAPIETFTASHSDRHPTDLAGLRGARLVTAVETEEGRRWAESKIKQLTGGDTISARFMRQDFFEYQPQFKLMIAGNNKPGLRSVDEAIRRRFNLLPFTVTIPPSDRDLDLAEKLKTEWPGILAWMLDGCLEWQANGLQPPAAVAAATAAYLDAQDTVAAWIEECCELRPDAWERSPELFSSWASWAERSGEFRGDLKSFKDRLEKRGMIHKREPGTGRTGYQGIRLKPPEIAHDGWHR